MVLPAWAQDLDKTDLEHFFMEGLANYEESVQRPIPDNLQRINRELYVADSGYYVTESVRAVSYFVRKKGKYYPLHNQSHPAESVVTLLSGYIGSTRYTVNLKQHCYNYSCEEVDVPLGRLLGFCINKCGFVPYVGIEVIDSYNIKASLFMVNQGLGYAHTIVFIIDPAILGKDSGIIKAEAYTFTPIYNLAS